MTPVAHSIFGTNALAKTPAPGFFHNDLAHCPLTHVPSSFPRLADTHELYVV
jgi:hypothetical protein